MIIDPISNTADTTISGLGGSIKWQGGILAPNGKIYFIPLTKTNILSLNTGLPKIPLWMLKPYFNKF